MKIPKYIEKALERRKNAAYIWNNNDYIIGKFIEDNEIEVDSMDYFGGVEGIVNPYFSNERIRQAILEK